MKEALQAKRPQPTVEKPSLLKRLRSFFRHS